MLRFACPHCSVKLTTHEDLAGRKVVCPHCKGTILVPKPSSPDPPAPLDRDLLELEEKGEAVDMGPCDEESESFRSPTGDTDGRRFPWPIDILLYPFNASGLIYLAAVIGVPLAIASIGAITYSAGTGPMLLLAPIVLAIGLYSIWYFAECVSESAQGQTRAPELIHSMPVLSDIWSRVFHLGLTRALFTWPASAYCDFAHERNAIYWLLLVWGIVLGPMGLLAMVMIDDVRALSPLLLFRSIFRTLPSYCGLMLVFAPFTFFMDPVFEIMKGKPLLIPHAILACVAIPYGTMITAHILGRFYWRNSERLVWEA